MNFDKYDYDYPFPQDSEIFYKVEEQPVWFNSYFKDTNHKTLWRKHGLTGEPTYLGTHNKDYTLVQNDEFFSQVEEQMINCFDPMMLRGVETKDHISKGGRVAVREYRFPSTETEITTSSGHKSPIQLRTIAWNCFDGSSKCKIIFGNIDMFCTNGMIIGEKNIIAKKRSKYFELSNFTKQLVELVDGFSDTINTYQEWATKRITNESAEEFFKKAFPAGKNDTNTDKLVSMYRDEASIRGNNLWSVVSAMTNFSSHFSEQYPMRKNGDEFMTLHRRQTEVRRVMHTPEFRELLAA